MKNRLMALVEEKAAKKERAKFDIGDTVDVHVRILEGNKERVQVFNGTVIARRGEGVREMFTVRRIVQGEVKRSGQARRAKLFYLRDRVGKATKLKERKSKLDLAASPNGNGAPK